MKPLFMKFASRAWALLKAGMAAADRSYRKSNDIYDRVSAGKEAHLRRAYHLYHDSL